MAIMHRTVVVIVFVAFVSIPVNTVYTVPATTGYHPPTAAAFDYCWQLYQDVFNGTYPYNKYMGPWVLMSDFIYVMMEADILEVETIVSLIICIYELYTRICYCSTALNKN
jgi:hypothetical protein